MAKDSGLKAVPTTHTQPASTVDQQGTSHLFKPGVSGNPRGRVKGSRNKLSEEFIHTLYEDYREHGTQTLQQVRQSDPSAYLKVIASLVPKEMHLKVDPYEEMTDSQLADRARHLAQQINIFLIDAPKLAIEGGVGGEDEGPPASGQTPQSQ